MSVTEIEVLKRYEDIPNFACSDKRVTEQGWRFALVGGVHRDSGVVDRCNHDEIVAQLRAADPDETGWDILGASHWAVGWYDHIIVDPTRADLVKILQECAAALASYLILNDTRHAEMESALRDAQWPGICQDLAHDLARIAEEITAADLFDDELDPIRWTIEGDLDMDALIAFCRVEPCDEFADASDNWIVRWSREDREALARAAVIAASLALWLQPLHRKG